MDIVSAHLIRSQLEAGIDQLERDAKKKSFNTNCIRRFGCAAKVLGHREICERALHLLQIAPDRSFFAGILTNLKLPTTPPRWMRTPGSFEEWEEDFSPYQEHKTLELIKAYAVHEEHFALCLNGHFAEARAHSASGLPLEEVGSTLAVLGEFDHAKSIAYDTALEASRQHGVKLVLVIELFRRRRIEEATTLLEELEATIIDPWDRIYLALGFAGREPWIGYPYPDW